MRVLVFNSRCRISIEKQWMVSRSQCG